MSFVFLDSNKSSSILFSFSPFAVIIILGGMFATTLILSNILIAQLTDSFSDVKKNAVIQYDIAKAHFVTRIENSRIRSLVSKESFAVCLQTDESFQIKPLDKKQYFCSKIGI